MSQRKRLLSVAYQCAAAVVRESKLGAPSHSLWTKAGSMSRVTGTLLRGISIWYIVYGRCFKCNLISKNNEGND
jgi:hypothetical protein